jgi:hypothetical protein
MVARSAAQRSETTSLFGTVQRHGCFEQPMTLQPPDPRGPLHKAPAEWYSGTGWRASRDGCIGAAAFLADPRSAPLARISRLPARGESACRRDLVARAAVAGLAEAMRARMACRPRNMPSCVKPPSSMTQSSHPRTDPAQVTPLGSCGVDLCAAPHPDQRHRPRAGRRAQAGPAPSTTALTAAASSTAGRPASPLGARIVGGDAMFSWTAPAG